MAAHLAALLLAWFAVAKLLSAQQPDTTDIASWLGAQEGSATLPEPEGPTPGGAFLRAVLLPGWGHAALGSYTRGGFYLAAESTTGFLLARTLWRLANAKQARDDVEQQLRGALLAAGTQPGSVPALLEADPAVEDARGLVDARRQQLEDWLAFSVFLVFLSGADAFVSAHLRDFPQPIGVEAALERRSGGAALQVGLSLPLGMPRRKH